MNLSYIFFIKKLILIQLLYLMNLFLEKFCSQLTHKHADIIELLTYGIIAGETVTNFMMKKPIKKIILLTDILDKKEIMNLIRMFENLYSVTTSINGEINKIELQFSDDEEIIVIYFYNLYAYKSISNFMKADCFCMYIGTKELLDRYGFKYIFNDSYDGLEYGMHISKKANKSIYFEHIYQYKENIHKGTINKLSKMGFYINDIKVSNKNPKYESRKDYNDVFPSNIIDEYVKLIYKDVTHITWYKEDIKRTYCFGKDNDGEYIKIYIKDIPKY